MSDAPIPDDILKSAFEIVEALESNKSGALTCSDARYATLLTNDANAIARALMAAIEVAIEAATTRERERCAEIALLHTKADVGDAAATAAEGLRLGAASIYSAILRGEA